MWEWVRNEAGLVEHPGRGADLGLRLAVVSPTMRGDTGKKGCFEGLKIGTF